MINKTRKGKLRKTKEKRKNEDEKDLQNSLPDSPILPLTHPGTKKKRKIKDEKVLRHELNKIQEE